ncbi:MAG: hypothetical protein ACE5GX_20175 [Thermoanaerobaculia bacterium]
MFVLVGMAVGSVALAQHEAGHHGTAVSERQTQAKTSSYAGLESRRVKALSEDQIAS